MGGGLSERVSTSFVWYSRAKSGVRGRRGREGGGGRVVDQGCEKYPSKVKQEGLN